MTEDDWVESNQIVGEKILCLLMAETEDVNVAVATMMDVLLYICYQYDVTSVTFNDMMDLAKAKYERRNEEEEPC